jgi:phage tail-like protein
MGKQVSVYDPIRAYKFEVTIGTGLSVGFQKVTGLKESSDVVEYREGNMPIHKRKLPGLTNYEPITCTRGAGPKGVASQLLDWRKAVARWGINPEYDGVQNVIGEADGGGFRKLVTIELYDKGVSIDSDNAAKRWNVHLAWPSEYSVADLNAEASEVLIETLVLQHEGLEPEPPSGGSANSLPA